MMRRSESCIVRDSCGPLVSDCSCLQLGKIIPGQIAMWGGAAVTEFETHACSGFEAL